VSVPRYLVTFTYNLGNNRTIREFLAHSAVDSFCMKVSKGREVGIKGRPTNTDLEVRVVREYP
jgi:hypothetical protein